MNGGLCKPESIRLQWNLIKSGLYTDIAQNVQAFHNPCCYQTFSVSHCISVKSHGSIKHEKKNWTIKCQCACIFYSEFVCFKISVLKYNFAVWHNFFLEAHICPLCNEFDVIKIQLNKSVEEVEIYSELLLLKRSNFVLLSPISYIQDISNLMYCTGFA